MCGKDSYLLTELLCWELLHIDTKQIFTDLELLVHSFLYMFTALSYPANKAVTVCNSPFVCSLFTPDSIFTTSTSARPGTGFRYRLHLALEKHSQPPGCGCFVLWELCPCIFTFKDALVPSWNGCYVGWVDHKSSAATAQREETPEPLKWLIFTSKSFLPRLYSTWIMTQNKLFFWCIIACMKPTNIPASVSFAVCVLRCQWWLAVALGFKLRLTPLQFLGWMLTYLAAVRTPHIR